MFKDSLAKYYQSNKERLQKGLVKNISSFILYKILHLYKSFQRRKIKKCKNMVAKMMCLNL